MKHFWQLLQVGPTGGGEEAGPEQPQRGPAAQKVCRQKSQVQVLGQGGGLLHH